MGTAALALRHNRIISLTLVLNLKIQTPCLRGVNTYVPRILHAAVNENKSQALSLQQQPQMTQHKINTR